MAVAVSISAAAQAETDPETVTIRTEPIPEINVVGERPLTRRAISKNIYQLAQSETNDEPIPRFLDPLCLSVAGLGDTLNERVADRIRRNAQDATLEIAPESCRANALVLVVDDPDKLIERIRDLHPLLFSPRVNNEIRGALSREDPVIGWNSTVVRSASGRATGAAGGGLAGAAGAALFQNAGADIPSNTGCLPSRIVRCYSFARSSSYVVFDVRELEDVHINQLADYATMYLIGSPRRLLDYDKLEAASIMTLFEDGPREAPIGLTQLDRAYLKGLYSLRPNANSQRLVGSTRAAYLQIAEADMGRGGEKADTPSEIPAEPRAEES
ncbi:MAG: hypothetical protein AAFY51_07285 [Pseudomonadota bacterium]